MTTSVAPQKTPSKGKDTRFFARISTVDKALIEEAADIVGQSTATFVISKAREAATQLLNGQNVIRLNREESRRVVNTLLSPPKPPTQAFLKALKEYRETVISDVNPNSPALLAKRASAGNTGR
jgi:uncharacterized protein (DUF1778 family)